MLNNLVSRFLLAFLSIEAILQETTIHRRRQRLRAIENGIDLGGAYGVTLGRIKAQGGEKARLGMAVLMWISHSRRPLHADEICSAVSIRIGSNDLNNDDISAIATLIGCCQGLVTIENGTSIIRLIHFTLQDYLCTHPDLFDRAHSTMAETCLTYLNFPHIKGISVGQSPDLRSTAFLEYSSLYWGTHMRMELSECAKTLALQLLGQFDSHISAETLWKSINRGSPRYTYASDKPFSALNCISYFGIAEVANILIKMNRWDVNQRDGVGMTPLRWAARYGHEEVARLLLRIKHVHPDQPEANSGRTALSWAAGNGHEGVVKLFIGPRFATPRNIGRRWGKVARAVGVLFGRRYVNFDSSSLSGHTPLWFAVSCGHEGIVKLLIGRKDVNPNGSSKSGRTPLSWAAENDHEGIVKLLLRREDINPDTPDAYNSRTPLSRAAENGHAGIVKLLLGREDVNPNGSGKPGRTPLALAAANGHDEIVRLLLGREDVSPNTPDAYPGRTPLSLAAENGHEGIAKLLLGRKDVNPDSSDESGLTPLAWAAGNGHETIVKLLLEREDVNPTSSSESGETPVTGRQEWA